MADEWRDLDAVVLIGAGGPTRRPGRDDVTHRFEAHSEYYYLTDRDRPGGVLAFDPDEGWVEFLAPVTADERLWEGAQPDPPRTRTTDDLEPWLARRDGRPTAWLGSAPAHRANRPEH